MIRRGLIVLLLTLVRWMLMSLLVILWEMRLVRTRIIPIVWIWWTKILEIGILPLIIKINQNFGKGLEECLVSKTIVYVEECTTLLHYHQLNVHQREGLIVFSDKAI